MLHSIRVIILVSVLFLLSGLCMGQEGMPPANVVVSEVGSGMVIPETEFIGTVYYSEVSDVASEVSGLVKEIMFDEGQRLEKGHVLVRLGSDLLNKRIQATTANYEEVLTQLSKAERDLERTEELFEDRLVSEQLYDEKKFNATALEKKAASLKAEVERLEVERGKKVVKAPFNGVIIKKHVEKGEWISPGSAVAKIANDETVEIVVDVPDHIIQVLSFSTDVRVKVGGEEVIGKISAIIPSGDISTRTFPVKIRIKNNASLIEGMEAVVILPAGKKQKTLTVHRDAVINARGDTVVYAVKDSKAIMIPVEVVGYEGLTAGISAEGLKEGMNVVVKGNERLRPGQAVNIQK